MANLRVLYVLRPAEGGMLEHVRALASHFEGAVAGPPALGRFFSGITFVPIPLSKDLNPVKDLACIRKLQMQANNYHIVHAHGYKAALVARLAVRGRQPVIFTVHNYPAAHISRLFYLVEKKIAAAYTDRYIAVSQALARQLTESWQLNPDKISVVINGISPPFCGGLKVQGRLLRRKLGIDAHDLVVGTLARLAPQKGIDLFLQAAAIIHRRRPDVKFLVGGNGPLRQELEQLSGLLGLNQAVKFVGSLEETPPFLAALDVFVLPSRSEGLSLTLMEAMACGVPVVASAVGGVPEVVGNDGILTAPTGFALAEGIEKMVIDKEMRQQYSARGPARVMKDFHQSRMLSETEQVYRAAAAGVSSNVNLL